MFRCLFAIVLFFLFSNHLSAQIIPKNGDSLNYRLIGFSIPANDKAVKYVLEVFEDEISDDGTGTSKKLFKLESNNNRIISTVPAFGKRYSWQISYVNKTGKVIDKTPVSTFVTRYNQFADTSKFRLKVIKNNVTNKDMYVFIDGTRCLYDMNGNPLWFIPDMPGLIDETVNIRDIKLTKQNTITFFTRNDAFEIDYHGNILWRAPNDGKVSGDSVEHYHHEFTRLSNGNYMVAGNASVILPLPKTVDAGAVKNDPTIFQRGDSMFKKVECGTIIEYDTTGKIVWVWRSGDYFSKADLLSRQSIREGGLSDTRTHMNSFFFDEKNKVIYAGFRDISRVVKISYPSGKCIASYGESYVENEPRQGDGFFHAQHAPMINNEGNLFLFNNNTPSRRYNNQVERASSLLVLKEPITDKDSLTKIWEFSCNIDSIASPIGGSGGNAHELENGSYIVCMGSTNRNFIVDINKKIVWNALSQMKNNDNIWTSYSNYRIFPIEKKQLLERLIWAENKKVNK